MSSFLRMNTIPQYVCILGSPFIHHHAGGLLPPLGYHKSCIYDIKPLRLVIDIDPEMELLGHLNSINTKSHASCSMLEKGALCA